MLGFILCPDCGECLGEIRMFVKNVKLGYVKKMVSRTDDYKEFTPTKMSFNPEIIPPIGDILDSAGLTNVCCRMHVMTETESAV